MKRITFSILFICLFLNTVNSQEQPVKKITFGAGLYLETPKLSDFYQEYEYPANRIIMSLNLYERFKIEPEFGLYLSESKDNWRETGTITGISTFYLFNKNRTTLYTGIVFELSNLSTVYFNIQPEEDDVRVVRSYILGPAFGMEYFFSEHFSLGGEIGLKYIAYRSINVTDNDDPRKEKRIITDTGIKLRYYF